MRWEGGDESENVEDRRGGVGATPIIGGASLLVVVVAYFLGIDPSQIIGYTQSREQDRSSHVSTPEETQSRKFISTILRYTEKVWAEQLPKMGRTYENPRLVIFERSVDTGCGAASSSAGPFYCPEDRTVYIDPTFFDELSERLGGSNAEFSQAYVIAHEIGHHVQVLLGYSNLVQEKRRQLPPAEFNRWSVRLELQADFLAGVWAHYGQEKFNFVESGDLEQALKSANAIGDDRLQRQSGGRISPQNFTHGTAAQRVKWYRLGFETGDLRLLQRIFEIPYSDL